MWILTGFLGAGKTTLINDILTGAHGLRLGVLVNEYGELGVDGTLIGAASPAVVEVPNGCICCVRQGDLGRGLAALLETGTELDGILIETSGLAEPLGVADTVDARRFSDRLTLAGIVTVVDAANFDANLDNAVVAYRQLVAADLLLVNKVDLVGDEVVEAIETNLARLNPSAAIVRSGNGSVPAWYFVTDDAAEVATPSRPRTASAGCVPEPGVESISCRLDGPLARERFEAWTGALPPGAWRVKALLQFDPGGPWFSYHRVGARESVARLGDTAVLPGAGRVVVVGRDLDGPSMTAALKHCQREQVPAHARVS